MADSLSELFDSPECLSSNTESRCSDKNLSFENHSASLDDVEADTPLEQRLLVDQDLFREKNNNLRTYSRRQEDMKKCIHIHLERCDIDDYDVVAVPLQEISLVEESPKSNGRTRRSKIQESPSPKKRRVAAKDSNDENESVQAGTSRRTRKISFTGANSSDPDLQSHSVKNKLEDQLHESIATTSEVPISPEESIFKDLSKSLPEKSERKRRITRSSFQHRLVADNGLNEQEPAEVTCTPSTKSPLEDHTDVGSNKPVEENTPESNVFKTPIFPTSSTKSLRSSIVSTVSYADVTCSTLDVTSDLNCSSDDDTSWNDSLECLELPNQLLELPKQPEEDLVAVKVEELADGELVLQQDQNLSVGSDSPLNSSSLFSEDDEEEFEFKKGTPVLAKVGNWPHWPSFVVPYHGCYRTVKNKKVYFHVVFCGNSHERAWVPLKRMLPFMSLMDCLVKFTENKEEPNTLNVPNKMYDKFKTAVADLIFYREEPIAFVEEFEIKVPAPKPNSSELKSLAANERLKSKQVRSEENESKRLKRMEEREQQRKERDLARKAREEARAQISRNVCLQCRNHENKSAEMKCTQCEFSFHLSCQGITEAPAAALFVCSFCQEQNMPCFVCFQHTQGDMLKCNVAKCNKWYHPRCLGEHWQQVTFDAKKEQVVSCPTHSCHTCVHRNLVSFKKTIDSRDKLVRCIKCPGTYHKEMECIPAAAIKINSHQIICPRHMDLQNKPRTALCQICCKTSRENGNPDSIRACRICPCTYHTECLDKDDLAVSRDDFMCVNCSDGFFPKFNDIVWAKLGSSRWWPAKVIAYDDIPDKLLEHKHKEGQFVIKFYGTDNFSWISNKSTFHIQDQIDVHSYSAVTQKDVKFLKGVQAAMEEVAERDLYWDQKVGLYYHTQVEKKPAVFRRIRTNDYVFPCKPFREQFADLAMCRCKPTDPDPCGESCENRVLSMECPKNCQCGVKCQNQRMQKHADARTELRFMGGKGWGLLAKEDLKQGTFVIEYVGEVVTKEEFKLRRASYAKNNEPHFYFLELGVNHYIDAKSKGNNSRFINHSCQPNCKSAQWYVNSLRRIGLFTLVDVKAGEELTFDYNWEKDGGTIQKCLCGTDTCQNFLAAEKTRRIGRPSSANPKPAVAPKEILDDAEPMDVDDSKGATCDVCLLAKSRNSTICSKCYENQEF